MSAGGAVIGIEKEQAMGRWGKAARWAAVLGAVTLSVWVSGDRGAFSASAANSGTDPFDVLDLQVKPYVGIIFDTSGSMKFAPNLPPGNFRFPVGGDDPTSRMWQAKRALRDVAREFRTRLNMGLYSFSPLTTDKSLTSNQTYDGDSCRPPGRALRLRVEQPRRTPLRLGPEQQRPARQPRRHLHV